MVLTRYLLLLLRIHLAALGPTPTDAVYVPLPVTSARSVVLRQVSLSSSTGFLPVIYTYFASGRHARVELPTVAEEESPVLDGKLTAQKPMRGWAILLMWIPALCDLIGTVVR